MQCSTGRNSVDSKSTQQPSFASHTFKCVKCSDKCESAEALRWHLTVYHLRWLPYECAFCEVYKATETELTNHIETNHSGSPVKVVFVANPANQRLLQLLIYQSTIAATACSLAEPAHKKARRSSSVDEETDNEREQMGVKAQQSSFDGRSQSTEQVVTSPSVRPTRAIHSTSTAKRELVDLSCDVISDNSGTAVSPQYNSLNCSTSGGIRKWCEATGGASEDSLVEDSPSPAGSAALPTRRQRKALTVEWPVKVPTRELSDEETCEVLDSVLPEGERLARDHIADTEDLELRVRKPVWFAIQHIFTRQQLTDMVGTVHAGRGSAGLLLSKNNCYVAHCMKYYCSRFNGYQGLTDERLLRAVFVYLQRMLRTRKDQLNKTILRESL